MTAFNVHVPKFLDRSAALSRVAAFTGDRKVVFSVRAASAERQNVIERDLFKLKRQVAKVTEPGVSQIDRLTTLCEMRRIVPTLGLSLAAVPFGRVLASQMERNPKSPARIRAEATRFRFGWLDRIRLKALLADLLDLSALKLAAASFAARLFISAAGRQEANGSAVLTGDFNGHVGCLL